MSDGKESAVQPPQVSNQFATDEVEPPKYDWKPENPDQREWLIKQLRRWPDRVDERYTCSQRFLMDAAANALTQAGDARLLEIQKIVDLYFEPWGASKGERWEEISGDKPFNGDSAFSLVRAALATPSPVAESRGGGVEHLARRLCNDQDARELAGATEQPSYDDSSPDVQLYWQTIASAALQADPGQRGERK